MPSTNASLFFLTLNETIFFFFLKTKRRKSYRKSQSSLKTLNLPQHLRDPLAMIPIRSPSSSASSMECVVNNIILPFLIFLINCHVRRIEYGSIPLVGSSRMITWKIKYIQRQLIRRNIRNEMSPCFLLTLLLPINAIPSDNFLFMPPESACTKVLILSDNPTWKKINTQDQTAVTCTQNW